MKYLCPCCMKSWDHVITKRIDLKRYKRVHTKFGVLNLQYYIPHPTILGRAMCPECALEPEYQASLVFPIDYQVLRQRIKMAGSN